MSSVTNIPGSSEQLRQDDLTTTTTTWLTMRPATKPSLFGNRTNGVRKSRRRIRAFRPVNVHAILVLTATVATNSSNQIGAFSQLLLANSGMIRPLLQLSREMAKAVRREPTAAGRSISITVNRTGVDKCGCAVLGKVTFRE